MVIRLAGCTWDFVVVLVVLLWDYWCACLCCRVLCVCINCDGILIFSHLMVAR